MSTLHITRGLPGSGKTTLARQWVAQDPLARARVNRDDLRAMLYDARTGLTREQEDHITTASQTLVRNLLSVGLDVIADDTNLDPRYIAQWRELARQCHADMRLHDMATPVEECIARDASREHTVGADVIRNLATMFMPHGTYLTTRTT